MKKEIAVCLMLILLVPTANVRGAEVEDNETQNIVYIEDEDALEDVGWETDAIVVEDDILSDLNPETLDEVLDDGCTLYVNGHDEDLIEDYLGEDVDNEGTVLGYQIEKSGGEYEIMPIDAEIAYREDSEDALADNDYEELTQSVELSENDYKELYGMDDSIDLSELREDSRAYLQEGADVSGSFGSSSHLTYYYRKSMFNWDTAAVTKKSSAEDGWQMIGWGRITIYALPAGGKGSDRFNAIYSVATVGGKNERAVVNFTTQTRLYEKTNAYIADYTELKGGKKELSTTIGSSAGASSESGLSATYSSGYSYTYDPDECSIYTMCDDPFITKWTIASPSAYGYIGAALKLTPMVLVHSAKDQTIKVSARIFDLKFYGAKKGFYTVKNHSGSQYTWMKIKNHTMTDKG